MVRPYDLVACRRSAAVEYRMLFETEHLKANAEMGTIAAVVDGDTIRF